MDTGHPSAGSWQAPGEVTPFPITGSATAAAIAAQLADEVYVTIDLDAFDPSQVAAVGTPEPGGLLWDEVCELLATAARKRRIVGFDVTELAPQANAQLAAKLTYRLIGLAVRE